MVLFDFKRVRHFMFGGVVNVDVWLMLDDDYKAMGSSFRIMSLAGAGEINATCKRVVGASVGNSAVSLTAQQWIEHEVFLPCCFRL